METREEVRVALESRALNHVFFQSVFGSEPTKELLEAICDNACYQSFEVFTQDDASSYASTLQSAVEVLEALRSRSDETLERVRSEYTKLYLGPAELEAPPWESMYLSRQHSLFQESTLEVRNTYRVQGFLPAEYPRVADDHIALEFAFMAQLAGRAKTAYDDGDLDTTKTALEASRQFLEDHMLVWVPDYVTALSGIEEAGFYPIMAQLALEFLKVDKGALDELSVEL